MLTLIGFDSDLNSCKKAIDVARLHLASEN
jgi:hypothetical protein